MLQVKPERDELGRVLRPAVLWLTGSAAPVPAPADCRATLPIDDGWLAELREGAQLSLTDARGARLQLHVMQRTRGTGARARRGEREHHAVHQERDARM